MAKLNPPILEGKIPPMVKPNSELESVSLRIPYVMNRSVSLDDVGAMMVKIKTIGGIELINLTVINDNDEETKDYFNDNEIYIADLGTDNIQKLNIQQYYKIQIAYQQAITQDIGYYSSVGIIKYAAQPTIICEQESNKGEYYFTGKYVPNEADKTEKFYSSHFTLYDTTDDHNYMPIEITEEKLHTNPDTDYENYEIRRDLNFNNHSYKVEFVATSVNGYVGAALVNVVPQVLDQFPTETQLVATNNYENGYVQLTTKGATLSSNYTYTIWRKANNSEDWEKLSIIFVPPYQDFTVEHGVTYTYAIQGIPIDTEENATEKLSASPLAARFEDIILGDKDKHLRIQFNPKINSFKRTILESKIDTIGGKYPMIMRNGNVNYQEIGISGLISYLIDPDELFMQFVDTNISKYRLETNAAANTRIPPSPTSLSDENRYKERQFREAVIAWLTNGEPKYFRSPTEGNHIIRLMNVSLTPNDTVGRLIYSFSATGYEIDDDTYSNLAKYRLASWEV